MSDFGGTPPDAGQPRWEGEARSRQADSPSVPGSAARASELSTPLTEWEVENLMIERGEKRDAVIRAARLVVATTPIKEPSKSDCDYYLARLREAIAALPDDPDDSEKTIEVNDGFGI